MSLRRSLFVVHYPVFGGPHNQALLLDRPQRELGWQTLVLLPSEPGNAAGRLRDAGVGVLQLPLGRLRANPDPRLQLRMLSRLPREIASVRHVIREHGIDLVVVAGLVNPHAAIAARLEGLPVVWQILDTRPPVAVRRAFMPLVLRLADVIMATGVQVARAHPGALSFGRRLVPFFPPVDGIEFKNSPERRARARQLLGLSPADLVVGNVGNLNPMKGHRTFIRAAADLRRTHPTTRFVILGASYDHRREYTESLWREARTLGLSPGSDLIVRDPGGTVADLAAAFDIFWLSSDLRSEGIPTVIGEAMALGLPVVATAVGGVQEAVSEETGFVVAPLDSRAIADATRALFDDPELRKRMATKGRRRALVHFDPNRCAQIHAAAFDLAVEHQRFRSSRRFIRGRRGS